jgi:hypothetical protein
MPYSVDSSTLVQIVRLYPSHLFVTLWDKLDAGFSTGNLLVTEEVYRELCKGTDGAAAWFKARPQCMVPTEKEVEARLKQIMKSHPALVQADLGKSGADPYVIAVALAHGHAVVTQERPKKPNSSRPRIPDVCTAYNIAYFDLFGLAQAEAWTF